MGKWIPTSSGSGLRAGYGSKRRAYFSSRAGDRPLEALTDAELGRIIDIGAQAELKLYHFKKKDDLPRVTAVLGFLRGVQPRSLLDVGSGRGAFLFSFFREFPDTPVTAVDLLPHRVELLSAVA